ncbi:MAG: VTC domain-containing protein [Chitinispirillaceae bacterium]
MKQKSIGPLLQRYELKYLIHRSMVEPISQFASIYCSLDKYSQISADNTYIVNSLYFDSPGYLFLKKRLEGEDNRFNMRVRTYGYDKNQPVFLEIKYKSGSILCKYRAKVNSSDYPSIITDGCFLPQEEDSSKENKNINLFMKLAHTYIAEPKVLIQYKRKAFVSRYDQYARITFDKNLCYKRQGGYSCVPEPEELLHCSDEFTFPSDEDVVLELKCYTSQVPLWMLDLIRTFDLHRSSFSKYLAGMREVYENRLYDFNDRQSTIHNHLKEASNAAHSF